MQINEVIIKKSYGNTKELGKSSDFEQQAGLDVRAAYKIIVIKILQH